MSLPNIPESTTDPSLVTAEPSPQLQPSRLIETVNSETVIYAFLGAYSEPTDDQANNLAVLLGLDPDALEGKLLEMLEQYSVDIDKVGDGDVHHDPVDLFLISYFLLNSTPTQEQLLALEAITGLLGDDFSDKVYALLTELDSSSSGDETEADEYEDDDSELDIDDDLDLDDDLADLELDD